MSEMVTDDNDKENQPIMQLNYTKELNFGDLLDSSSAIESSSHPSREYLQAKFQSLKCKYQECQILRNYIERISHGDFMKILEARANEEETLHSECQKEKQNLKLQKNRQMEYDLTNKTRATKIVEVHSQIETNKLNIKQLQSSLEEKKKKLALIQQKTKEKKLEVIKNHNICISSSDEISQILDQQMVAIQELNQKKGSLQDMLLEYQMKNKLLKEKLQEEEKVLDHPQDPNISAKKEELNKLENMKQWFSELGKTFSYLMGVQVVSFDSKSLNLTILSSYQLELTYETNVLKQAKLTPNDIDIQDLLEHEPIDSLSIVREIRDRIRKKTLTT